MKTKLLDLNAYGVEEMSVAEMRETEGGGAFWIGLGLGALVGILVWRSMQEGEQQAEEQKKCKNN